MRSVNVSSVYDYFSQKKKTIKKSKLTVTVCMYINILVFPDIRSLFVMYKNNKIIQIIDFSFAPTKHNFLPESSNKV